MGHRAGASVQELREALRWCFCFKTSLVCWTAPKEQSGVWFLQRAARWQSLLGFSAENSVGLAEHSSGEKLTISSVFWVAGAGVSTPCDVPVVLHFCTSSLGCLRSGAEQSMHQGWLRLLMERGLLLLGAGTAPVLSGLHGEIGWEAAGIWLEAWCWGMGGSRQWDLLGTQPAHTQCSLHRLCPHSPVCHCLSVASYCAAPHSPLLSELG